MAQERTPGPRPRHGWSRHGGEHFAVRASVAVPVLPGAEDVTVSVVATWELRSG